MIYLYMGKGGVGKTTCAAAHAVSLADSGRKTLVVSLDPAHNLGDVLDVELGDEPRKVAENLWAMEPDFEKVISKYLKELTERVKDVYGYLKIFNLDNYVDTLRYSPGVEEDAVLRKIMEILRMKGYEEIVLDTPPTGLTVRMLVLPSVSLTWIEKLMELRLRLLGARRALEKLSGEKLVIRRGETEISVPTDPEDDPIFKELEALRKEISWVQGILTDGGRTSVSMVVNPDVLSVREASRAIGVLRKVGIPMRRLIVNKYLRLSETPSELEETVREQEEALGLAKKELGFLETVVVPLFPREPRGFEALREVARFLA